MIKSAIYIYIVNSSLNKGYVCMHVCMDGCLDIT